MTTPQPVWRCTLIDPKTGACVCQFLYRTLKGFEKTMAALNPGDRYIIG